MALPKRHRLRGHRAIDHLHRHGRRHHTAHLLLRVTPAVPSLLSTQDRVAGSSPWRCALVISAKVHKRAVVRNRLRRLLHRHLLTSLPRPAEPVLGNPPAPGSKAMAPAGMEPRASDDQPLGWPGPQSQSEPGSPVGAWSGTESDDDAATLREPAGSSLVSRSPAGEQPTDGAGPAVAAPPSPSAPLWLMVSLRPGSAELESDQLLGECTLVLRRAGLIP